MRILVIGPSWVGDMMMSQTLYRSLRERYPRATIDVMAPAWCKQLLPSMPEVNKAILMPIRHGALAIGERYKLAHNLREKYYDQAYVLPNSFKSALVPFLAGVPHRIGWRGEMRYTLLNDVRVLDKGAWPLMVERYAALAYDKGVIRSAKDLPKPLLWPKLQIDQGTISYTCTVFSISLERPMIGFFPGAEFGPAKCWPHYHFAELAKKLIDEGYQIVLFGSGNIYGVGNKILSTLRAKDQRWCRNLVGETRLDQAVTLIASCKAVVTNDSGLMHVAAALNRPLVALYGPTSPDFTPPLSNKARIIRLITGYHKVRKGNLAEGYHESMIKITPQKVLEELYELLLRKEA